jgi:hypothetical protein
MVDNNSYRGLIPAEHGGACNNPATCPIRLNNAILVAQPIVCTAILEKYCLCLFFFPPFTRMSRHSDCLFFYPSQAVVGEHGQCALSSSRCSLPVDLSARERAAPRPRGAMPFRRGNAPRPAAWTKLVVSPAQSLMYLTVSAARNSLHMHTYVALLSFQLYIMSRIT